VGGDFYDFLELPGGSTAVVVADVSGKGVPAAISMARLVSQIRGGLARSPDVAELLLSLNRSLLRQADGERFLTLVAAVLDPLSNEVAIWRCGHPPPLLVEADGVRELETDATPPLGLTDELEPVAHRFPLRPGGLLLLYTDGAIDARDHAGEPFGRDRLREAARGAGLSASAVVDGVQRAVEAYARVGQRDDDLTLVAVERTPE
jgi:sigma-B regulation protein RsbU (phosphoserine phosphatase)